jgi:hypothetical protein
MSVYRESCFARGHQQQHDLDRIRADIRKGKGKGKVKRARRMSEAQVTTWKGKLAMSEIDVAELKAELRELKDVREINELWFKWHHSCTGGFNGKQAGRMEALECLAEDATIEIQGLHEPGKGPKGPKQCTEFWEYFYGDNGPLPYVFQCSVSERVKVTGDTAVQESVQFAIIGPRGQKPRAGLVQRTNNLVRTPAGWRIQKVAHGGGFFFPLGELQGNLNSLPEMEARTPWTYSA